MGESLRDLVVSLSLNSDNFSRNMKSVVAQVKEAESHFALAGAGITAFESTTAGLGSKLSMLQQKMALQKTAVDQYQRALTMANDKLTQSVARHDKVKTSLDQAKQKYSTLGTEITRLKTEMAQLEQTEGASADQYVALGTQLEQLEQEYAATDNEIKKLEGQLTSSNKAMQTAADGVTTAQTNLNNAQTALRQTEEAIRNCDRALRGLNWTQAGARLTAFSKKALAAGRQLTQLGRTMIRYATTPIVALGASAVKSSMSFESAFAGVRKTVKATEAEYAELMGKIEQMSLKMPSTVEDFSALMETAGQLGVQKKSLMDFTKVMTDLGKTTNLAGETGAAALAKFANITGMSQTQFDRLGSVIFRLDTNTATTASDIVEMGMRLAGAGHQIGLTEAQIMAFAASLSSVGIEAQAGGSAFSKIMVKMQLATETGKDGLEDFARVAGMSTKEFQTSFKNNAASALQAFIVGLSRMDEEGVSTIKTLQDMGLTEVRLRDTLMRATNANELFTNTLAMADDEWKRNQALVEGAAQRYNTTESQLQILKNQASMFARTIGNDLMPTVRNLMGDIGGMLDGFTAMDKAQRDSIIQTALMVAAAGPAIAVLGKIVTTTGKVTGALGKFSTAVGTAGGGLSGLISVIGSSKLAVLGLTVALGVGVYKFLDWVSGAKAAREATESMIRTAEAWASTQAKTIYDTGNDPFARFKVSKEDFGSTNTTAAWLQDVKRVWSDGKKETNEIVSSFIDGFKSQSDAIRKAVEDRNEKLKGSGASIPPEVEKKQQEQLKQLSAYDKEVEQLLKKRQNKKLSEKDQQRLDEIIVLRAQLRIDLGVDNDGYKTVIDNAKAEIARLAAAGEQPGIDLFGDAMKAAAQGRAAVNEGLDESYIAQYKLIQAMDDEAAKAEALAALDEKYAADRKTAAEEYAQALADIYATTYNTPEGESGDGTESKIKTLTDLLNEFQVANAGEENTSGILQQMDELTKGMDEGELASYYAMLSQIEEALASSGKTAEELFPDIPDPTKALENYKSLKTFLDENQSSFEGLQKMFSDGLEGEVKRVLVDLDLIKAEESWTAWAADKIITVTGVDASGATFTTLPQTEALITFYKNAEGAGIVSATPETAAIITQYEKGEGLTTDGVKAIVKAIVDGYEMNPGEEIDTTALSPMVVGLINDYKDNSTDEQKAALQPEFEALVTSWREGGDSADSKAALLAALTAYITKYDDAGATKPNIQLAATVSPMLSNIDAQRIAAWKQINQAKLGEFSAPVRLGLITDETTIAALKAGAVNLFGADGLPIAIKPGVSPEDVVTPESLVIGADENGNLNIVVVPKLGSTEGMEEAEKGMSASANPNLPDWLTTNTAKKVEAIKKNIEWLDILAQKEQDYQTKESAANTKNWIGELFDGLNPEDMQNMSNYIANALTALEDPEIDPEKAEELRTYLTTLQEVLQKSGEFNTVGGDISGGIAEGMNGYGWDGDASTLAAAIEAAIRGATQTHSPSQMTVPIGQGITQGVGQGMTQVSLSSYAQTVASSAKSVLSAALSGTIFRPVGVNAMAGLASGILSGKNAVVNAIRMVALAAVAAAKSTLKIQSPSKVFRDEVGIMLPKGIAQGVMQETKAQAKVIANASRYLTGAARDGVYSGIANDNRRTYHNDNSATVTVEKMYVKDKNDVRALAHEINALTRHVQFGYGG